MELKRLGYEMRVYETRQEMGREAARSVSVTVQKLLQEQETVRMIFAAAPSQNEFLECFASDEEIDFRRIEAFHMDEYIGLAHDAPQGFGNFLRTRLFEKVPFKRVNYLDGNAAEPSKECERYAALLNEAPIDIVCMGIGENGHIAFNDPHVADIKDTWDVKMVQLDETCRMQQVHDGCFGQIQEVPETAFTLTVPRLCKARYHFCIVPGMTKSQAVYQTVYGPIVNSCPASALRLCKCAIMFLDKAGAMRL